MKQLCMFLSLSIMAIGVSCKQEKKETTPTKMQQVIKIHDEVMPKMGTIAKLVAELKSKVDSNETDQNYEKAIKDLQEGNKAMMDWMQGFGNRFDSDEIMNGKKISGEKQQWLDEEEEKIKAVRDQVNSSIARAEKILAQQ